MFIKNLLNKDIFLLILSILLGLIIFNFINKTGSFIFLDTSVPWSKEAWNLALNDHIYAWNNMLGGGYPRTTYLSQGITFMVINLFVSVFDDINTSFYIFYSVVFGLGVFFGYKFINLYVNNKFISYLAGLFIFINPFSIQWISLFVFYIALFGLTFSLYFFVKYLRENKILYLLFFSIGILLLFTYQRFIFSSIFIFSFLLIFENRDSIKKIFSKNLLKKYGIIIISLIGINSIWFTPIILNKIDGEKTVDGYENHLLHNQMYEQENIYNGLHNNSNLINFINLNDITDNYARFFQNYHGENNFILFFPFLILVLFLILILSKKANRSNIYILAYYIFILFLLYSFYFLSLSNYSILNKIIPALNVTHFYFQLTLIPVFSLIIGYTLNFLYEKKKIFYFIVILNVVYFVVLVKPIVLNQDIYQNKNISNYQFNNCGNSYYKSYETLVYPFSLNSIGFTFNNNLLPYTISYNNCVRLFNYSMYQLSTFEGKNIRDSLFNTNFNGFDFETLKKYNIGEIVLLNENLFSSYNDDLFKQEYGNIKNILIQKGYKVTEKNENYGIYKIFDNNLSWEFRGVGDVNIIPISYSKYYINLSNKSDGDLIFKESYHKKWQLYKVDDLQCESKTDINLIINNENYNKNFFNGFNDLLNFLLGKYSNIPNKIEIIDGYVSKINIAGLEKGCYMYYFKPQLYFYAGMIISGLTFLTLIILTLIQEIRAYLRRRSG